MMDTARADLITLLKIHLNQHRANEQIVGEEWERIYEYASIHHVEAMVKNALEFLPDDQKPDEKIKAKFDRKFAQTIMLRVSQDEAMEEVIQKLNEKRILHILMKGYILKSIYPVPELRTMGDIDLLIQEEQRLECHEAMLELGFTCTLEKGFVWCYVRDNVLLEIHTNLVSGEKWKSVDLERYYSQIFKQIELVKNSTYCLKKEYHLIYLITHAAKHFRGAGYGIRGIMDFVVFLRAYGRELDWDEIWTELELLHLKRYAYAVFLLCERWFGMTEISKLEKSLDEAEYELFTEIIFEGGIYGYCNSSMERVQVRNQMNEKVKGKIGMVKLRSGFKAVFPGYRYMRIYFKPLEKHPVLLPVAWGVRWYEAIFKRGKRNAKRIQDFLSVGDGITREYELLRKLDLL